MPDEAKPEDTENSSPIPSSAESNRKWTIQERLNWLREQGVTVIDASQTGRNIAIIGLSSGPASR